MKWIRYEILLPLSYNDGRPIESAKFRQTTRDLLENFSATTLDLLTAVGSWKYQGTLYEDLLLRLIVDVPAATPADDFFRNYKETLKARFEQIDNCFNSLEESDHSLTLGADPAAAVSRAPASRGRLAEPSLSGPSGIGCSTVLSTPGL